MNRDKLLAMLADQQIPGVLCSSDGKGQVNAAVFGSVRLLDDQKIVVGLGDNRTLENLQKNPKATYIFYTPGQSVLTWQGARLYLKVIRFDKTGQLFDQVIADAEIAAGKMAASMLTNAVTFEINEVRPLIDLSR